MARFEAGCPPLVTYRPEFMKAAADQYSKLTPNSPLRVMTTDYSKLRDACRVK